MNNYFDITVKHRITEANINYYAIPTQHPSRIMTNHDFVYIIDGEWTIGQEQEVFHVKKGDVLILGANLYHFGIEPCLPKTRTLYVHALALESDGQSFAPDGKIILRSHINASANPNVRNCFEKIAYAHLGDNGAMASAYFDVLLCELRSCDTTVQSPLAESIRKRIVASSDIPTNAEIARELNVSVKTAENAFRAAFNISIHKFALNVRIESAKYYLLNYPDMKLGEIAANLGFYDEFHMSRHFKRSVGIAPGEYRKAKR